MFMDKIKLYYVFFYKIIYLTFFILVVQKIYSKNLIKKKIPTLKANELCALLLFISTLES